MAKNRWKRNRIASLEAGIDGNREEFLKFPSVGIESADSGDSVGSESWERLLELLPLGSWGKHPLFPRFFPIFLVPDSSFRGHLDSGGFLGMPGAAGCWKLPEMSYSLEVSLWLSSFSSPFSTCSGSPPQGMGSAMGLPGKKSPKMPGKGVLGTELPPLPALQPPFPRDFVLPSTKGTELPEHSRPLSRPSRAGAAGGRNWGQGGRFWVGTGMARRGTIP